MEGRIKMQKVLLTANRLPQPDTYPRFRKEGGQDFDHAVENCKSLLMFLLCSDPCRQFPIAVQCRAGCFVQRHLVPGVCWGSECRGLPRAGAVQPKGGAVHRGSSMELLQLFIPEPLL